MTMMNIYLLGGFPYDTSEQALRNIIEGDLEVKSLSDLWLDPQHERRAVFICSEKLEFKKMHLLLEKKPYKNKILFIDDENETEILYVEVPSMKCIGLIDKLRYLFHQKKNGGSKVKALEKVKENNFKLIFQDGWEAVRNVTKSRWYIDKTEVKITPFFASFQEDYKTQKRRYDIGNEQTVDRENPRMLPKVSRTSARQDLACDEPSSSPKSSDQTTKQTAQEKPTIARKPLKNDNQFGFEGKKPSIPPKPKEKPSVPPEFPIKNAPDMIKKDDKSISPPEEAQSVHEVKEEETTLPSKTENKKHIQLVEQDVPRQSKPLQTTPKRENIYLNYEAHCVLLHCLGLETEMKRKHKDLELTIDLENWVLSMTGPGPLRKKLFSMFIKQIGDLTVQMEDVGLFIYRENHERITKLFDDKNYAVVLEESQSGDEINMFVRRRGMKKTVDNFLSLEIKLLKTFELPKPSPEKEKVFKEFKTKFNKENFQYQVDEDSYNNAWSLFCFSVDEHKTSQKLENEIESFLKLHSKPEVKVEGISSRLDFLVLLICLSLEERTKTCCDDVTAKIDKEKEMITLRGPPKDVLKLKEMLLNAIGAFKSKFQNHFPMEFEKFLSVDVNQDLFKTHFKLLLEPVGDKIVVYIQDKKNQKGTFQDFITTVLNKVMCFQLQDSPSNLDTLEEYLNDFNSRHIDSFQLIQMDEQWLLIKLTYNDDDQVNKNIQDFLIKPLGTDTNRKHKGSSDSEDNDEYQDCNESIPASAKDDNSRNQSQTNEEDRKGKGPPPLKPLPGQYKNKRSDDSRYQYEQKIDLSPMQIKFFQKIGCESIKQHLHPDVKFDGSRLIFSVDDEKTYNYNAVSAYLMGIKEERFSLDYPGLQEFWKSEEGCQIFDKVEATHTCVITSPSTGAKPRSGSEKQGTKTETRYKVAVLGSYNLSGNVHIHITQGDSRNIPYDGSIHVVSENMSHTNSTNQPMLLKLPQHPFGDGSYKAEKELKEKFQEAFNKAENKGWETIVLSVNSKCIGVVPCHVLARIIKETASGIKIRSGTVHVFLSENNSFPLLKAYNYVFSGFTQYFKPPNADIWNRVSCQTECKAYPDDMKISVTVNFQEPQYIRGKKVLTCFPITSPLEESTSQLKNELKPLWKYTQAIEKAEQELPDGLVVGEVFKLRGVTLGDTDVALYGFQAWGIGIKQALQDTLENCMNELTLSVTGSYDLLYIVVPGQIYNCPKEWFVSKWFELLDAWVRKRPDKKLSVDVHFIVEQPMFELFQEHQLRRSKVQKGYLSRLTSYAGSLIGTSDYIPDESTKSFQNSVEFAVIAQGESRVKRVSQDLNSKMKDLMQKNEVKKELSVYDYNRLWREFERNRNVKCQWNEKRIRKGGKKKQSRWMLTVSGLTRKSLEEIKWELGIGWNGDGSNVDPINKSSDRQDQDIEQQNDQFNRYDRRIENNEHISVEHNTTEVLKGAHNAVSCSSQNISAGCQRRESAMDVDGGSDDKDDKELTGDDMGKRGKTRGKVSMDREERDETSMEMETKDAGPLNTDSDGDVCKSKTESHIPTDVDSFIWCHHNGPYSEEFYNEDCELLERSYRTGDSVCLVDEMTVEFSSMFAKSKDDPVVQYAITRHDTIGTKKFRSPDDWSSGEMCVELKRKKDKRIYDKEIGDELLMNKVERIQSTPLYNRFCSSKNAMAKRYPENEKVLWQRINDDYKEKITEYGCHKSFLTIRCDELGDGICFASEPKYCVRESDMKDKTKPFTLVRCKVCLGEEGKGQPGLKFPPTNSSSVSNEKFSMVFSPHQVYPTHFIEVECELDK